jgi:quercetin dioxygenase-like cupin family protein
VSYRVLPAGGADWRTSALTGVLNTDVAEQLGTVVFGARLWRLAPGQALARHRHREETELYVVLAGTGRMRVGDESLTLPPLSAVHVEPATLRQVFNDTDRDALWLVVGAPPEGAAIRAMGPKELAELYPDGPQALPPELA